MPSLRGTADEAELIPPWGFFREGPPPRGPRRFVFGRDHLRVVRVSPRRFSQSASV